MNCQQSLVNRKLQPLSRWIATVWRERKPSLWWVVDETADKDLFIFHICFEWLWIRRDCFLLAQRNILPWDVGKTLWQGKPIKYKTCRCSWWTESPPKDWRERIENYQYHNKITK